MKINIKGIPKKELEEKIVSLGGKKYNAVQIMQWLYKRNIYNFSEMTNLSKNLKEMLNEHCCVNELKIVSKKISSIDKTTKYLLECEDKEKIECVLLFHSARNTLCVSSQVGCKFGCIFCATGLSGFKRNLTCAEILDQLILVQRDSKVQINNIVFMGMGEPLENYTETLNAISILMAPEAFNIGPRKITISTVGFVPGIEKLIKEKIPLNLSVSLHSVDDIIRSELMPVNNKYPLGKLLPLVKTYPKITGGKLTFEYTLIDKVNDSFKEIKKLASLTGDIKCKVNLIPFNCVSGVEYKKVKIEQVEKWKKVLENNKITVTVRHEKGSDICAACGQLRALNL
ncbi:MAG: 23S rRNA (adenine(2503)-C(2))-methyltransferase RlmN [Candidatus Firestonebacteria bacterium]